MKIFGKYKKELFFLILIIGLYFLLRLPNLTLQPIFVDEAIYIRWAQVMRAEPTLRFLPLSDGKTPLFMWVLIPLLKIIHDPLLAGRFLSTLSGLLTLLGVFTLSWKIFNPRVALMSALIYTVVPYTVFFDRMALVDAMLSAFAIWSLFFSILLLKKQKLDLAMILGYLLGGGILTKTPGMFNILILPVTLIGVEFKDKSRLIKLMGLMILSMGIALVIYNLLRLGPGFSQLSSRNQDYVFSPLNLLSRPWDPLLPHLRDLVDWLPKLLTWPVLILGIFGVFRVVREKQRLGLVVLLWAALPLLIQLALLKTFTARYILFSIPPLLVMAGFGLDQVSKGLKVPKVSKIFVQIMLLLLVLILSLHFDYLLLTNPQKAPLPKEERAGYFEMWTAGYGFKEIARFLIEKRKEGKVVVGTEGYFGTLPDGLQIYLDKEDIPVIGGTGTISGKLREAARGNEVYFVANHIRIVEPKNAKLIKEYPKAKPLNGSPADAIVIYQVYPE